jgi:hypothetical protein
LIILLFEIPVTFWAILGTTATIPKNKAPTAVIRVTILFKYSESKVSEYCRAFGAFYVKK